MEITFVQKKFPFVQEKFPFVQEKFTFVHGKKLAVSINNFSELKHQRTE